MFGVQGLGFGVPGLEDMLYGERILTRTPYTSFIVCSVYLPGALHPQPLNPYSPKSLEP